MHPYNDLFVFYMALLSCGEFGTSFQRDYTSEMCYLTDTERRDSQDKTSKQIDRLRLA